jgi:hypothetical protein
MEKRKSKLYVIWRRLGRFQSMSGLGRNDQTMEGIQLSMNAVHMIEPDNLEAQIRHRGSVYKFLLEVPSCL